MTELVKTKLRLPQDPVHGSLFRDVSRRNNVGVVVIAGHSRELPGFPNTGVFASNKAWDAGVRTMADMKGRVIGLTTIGSTNHYAVARIAEKYGFDINDNHLVPAQGLGNLAAMLMGNQVDVASGAEDVVDEKAQPDAGRRVAVVGEPRDGALSPWPAGLAGDAHAANGHQIVEVENCRWRLPR